MIVNDGHELRWRLAAPQCGKACLTGATVAHSGGLASAVLRRSLDNYFELTERQAALSWLSYILFGLKAPQTGQSVVLVCCTENN